MIQTTIGDPTPPCGHGGNWGFDDVSKIAETSEVRNDFIGKSLHADCIAIIATYGQEAVCDNRDRIVEPDGDNAYMDLDTLKRLMAEHGETQADLARLLEITPDKMSKVMKGKRRLTVSEANKLTRYFGTENNLDLLPTLLPIIGLVRAGSWREAVEFPRGYMPSPDRALSKDAFVVIIEGDSMDLVAQDGEAIIIEPAERELLGGRYYVIMNGEGETTFKRYMDNPARFEPCSSNADHQAMLIGGEQFTIVGRARKKVTDL